MMDKNQFLIALVEAGHPMFHGWDPSARGGYRIPRLDSMYDFVEAARRRGLEKFSAISRRGLVVMGAMEWRDDA